MEIICDSCSAKLKIPDEKIPEGKTATLACPKCKKKISVSRSANEDKEEVPAPAPEPSAAFDSFDFQEDDAEDFDSSDEKAFDFIEEEGLTALICEIDPNVRKIITKNLNLMEYNITVAANTRDAMKKMRYHDYDLIIINETFDTQNPDANGILIYLDRLNMSTRRNMIVALLSNRFRTMDPMMAFVRSVNFIINLNDIESFDKYIQSGINETTFFYRVFKETMKKVGIY